jgi:hypothetical protein
MANACGGIERAWDFARRTQADVLLLAASARKTRWHKTLDAPDAADARFGGHDDGTEPLQEGAVSNF